MKMCRHRRNGSIQRNPDPCTAKPMEINQHDLDVTNLRPASRLELVKNFRLISNNFVSDGGGRWIFGLAPDLIVRPDGSLSPVHANSTTDGFECQFKKLLLYAYWGGVYIPKNIAMDPATNKWIGYGYPGSGAGQNRVIQEPSFGSTQTFWKDPKFGALQMILQYSYVTRDPWFVATGQPSNAHAHMIFADLRYVLPGSAPRVESRCLGEPI
ncbi:MAG: hypothetical protein LAP39_01500 [Acidobacteriia bacterium]|nr:hypothetical protein [Terriglobia bacterium]